MTQYQLLPSLSQDEYQSLKDDIAQRGVQVPIEYDEAGNILDGHHRIMACQELGIKDYPSIVRVGMSEQEKRLHVYKLNLYRRHLEPEQRREIAGKLRYEEGLTYEKIGGMLGVSHETARTDAENSEFKNLKSEIINARGQSRPSVYNKNKRDQQRTFSALSKLPELPDNAPTEMDSKQISKMAMDAQKAERRLEAANGITGELPVDATILLGDFREQLANLPDDSVDLIFTDPPYDAETVPLYGDLARIAARILKPGGSLLAYAGNYALPDYFDFMTPYLRYWWTIALFHDGQGGNARLPGKWVYVEWKPIIWFVKGGRYNNEYVSDRFNTHDQGKEYHEWQQSIEEAQYYIERLSEPGGTIVDPFCGSGTTLIAALKSGKKSIGVEIDPARRNAAITRIREAGYGTI